MDRLYWETSGRDRGQIVEVSHPQVMGAAEGEEGDGLGLTLRYDRSDQEWSITDADLGAVAAGKHGDPIPSVADAIALREAIAKRGA